MRYYIIAGEASGDLHGAHLIEALKHQDPEAEIWCWGGEKMEKAGGVLRKHYKDLAFMGFVEVFLNLKTIWKNMDFCKKDILKFAPDAVIFIDYPGFNLKIAPFVKRLGIKVIYYIAPQLWAWHASRIKHLKKYVDKLIVILPFEKNYFLEKGMNSEYVGHPLLDAIAAYTPEPLPWTPSKPVIALLPGSRIQEIRSILPTMLEVTLEFPQYEFILAANKHIGENYYAQFLKNYPAVKIVYDRTYDVLSISLSAMVKSGTATLETALFKVPEVVCYKGNPISYLIAKKLIKNIRYISLVNLIMDKEVVKELIQFNFNKKQVFLELKELIENQHKRDVILSDYQELVDKLGKKGVSEKTAFTIIEEIKR